MGPKNSWQGFDSFRFRGFYTELYFFGLLNGWDLRKRIRTFYGNGFVCQWKVPKNSDWPISTASEFCLWLLLTHLLVTIALPQCMKFSRTRKENVDKMFNLKEPDIEKKTFSERSWCSFACYKSTFKFHSKWPQILDLTLDLKFLIESFP